MCCREQDTECNSVNDVAVTFMNELESSSNAILDVDITGKLVEKCMPNKKNLFEVYYCFNDYHSISVKITIILSDHNQTFTTHIMLNGYTPSKGSMVSTNPMPKISNSAANTIGGVLGFITVVLLVLLILSGIALVCLLRPDLRRKRMLSVR